MKYTDVLMYTTYQNSYTLELSWVQVHVVAFNKSLYHASKAK